MLSLYKKGAQQNVQHPYPQQPRKEWIEGKEQQFR